MQTFFYILWLIIPVGYYLIALWSKLEQSTQRKKGKNMVNEASDLFISANHLALCCFLAFLADRYLTFSYIKPNIPDMVPIGLVQLLILPAVMYLVSIGKGQWKQIKIQKAPRPSESKRNRRRK